MTPASYNADPKRAALLFTPSAQNEDFTEVGIQYPAYPKDPPRMEPVSEKPKGMHHDTYERLS
jgi:hypothetical protein